MVSVAPLPTSEFRRVHVNSAAGHPPVSEQFKTTRSPTKASSRAGETATLGDSKKKLNTKYIYRINEPRTMSSADAVFVSPEASVTEQT